MDSLFFQYLNRRITYFFIYDFQYARMAVNDGHLTPKTGRCLPYLCCDHFSTQEHNRRWPFSDLPEIVRSKNILPPVSLNRDHFW